MSILNLEISVDIFIYINIFSNKNNNLKFYICKFRKFKKLYRIVKIIINFLII